MELYMRIERARLAEVITAGFKEEPEESVTLFLDRPEPDCVFDDEIVAKVSLALPDSDVMLFHRRASDPEFPGYIEMPAHIVNEHASLRVASDR